MPKSPPIHRTPLYRAKAAYSGMHRRALNACGTEPAYAQVELRMTLEEWLRWSIRRYARFIKRYPNEIPNAARIGDTGHYEIGNIQIISQKQNRAEQAERHSMRLNNSKPCTICKIVKPLTEFGIRNAVRDGRLAQCRACRKLTR